MGFGDIVTNCFINYDPFKNTVPSLSWCDPLLDQVDGILNKDKELSDGSTLEKRITAVIDEAEKHLKDNGHIFWTGYGTFFDESTLKPDSDDPCDSVSWNIINNFGTHTLTKEHRKRANQLVKDMNRKLKGIVEGRKHIFVDWDGSTSDSRFEKICAPGSNPGHKVGRSDPDYQQSPFEMYIEPPFTSRPGDDRLKRRLFDDLKTEWISSMHPSKMGHMLIGTVLKRRLLAQVRWSKEGTPDSTTSSSTTDHPTSTTMAATTTPASTTRPTPRPKPSWCSHHPRSSTGFATMSK